MEINGSNPLAGLGASIQRLDFQQQQDQRTQRAGEDGTPSNRDRIEISVRSREVQRLDELIRSTPDIREARVDELRRAVESGTYNVRAEKIADKILSGSLIDEIF